MLRKSLFRLFALQNWLRMNASEKIELKTAQNVKKLRGQIQRLSSRNSFANHKLSENLV